MAGGNAKGEIQLNTIRWQFYCALQITKFYRILPVNRNIPINLLVFEWRRQNICFGLVIHSFLLQEARHLDFEFDLGQCDENAL